MRGIVYLSKTVVESVLLIDFQCSLLRLGHRPPPGSLAAVAQSAADRNESGGNRINGGPAGIDLNRIDQEDASKLMSEEHRRYVLVSQVFFSGMKLTGI